MTHRDKEILRTQFIKAKHEVSERETRFRENVLIGATIVLFSLGFNVSIALLGSGLSTLFDWIGFFLGLGLTMGSFAAAWSFHGTRDRARMNYKKAKDAYRPFRTEGGKV